MLTKLRKLIRNQAVLLLVAMLLVMQAIPEVVQGAPPPEQYAINGDTVKVGDIVAKGKLRAGGGCDFGGVTVTTTAPGQGKSRWVNIHIDPQCQAIVSAKWDGDLTQGPPHVVEPLQSVLGTATPPVREQEVQQNSLGVSSTVGIMSSGTKTSEQHIYTYGGGGPLWDQLTHKWGTLTFSWDGANAWTNSQSGTCQGSNPFNWRWVVDGCWTTGTNNGPAWHVSRSGQGDYHCDSPDQFPCNLSDPDGYYHSLYDYENGYGDGTSTCTYSHSGNIVFGPNRDILQGCN